MNFTFSNIEWPLHKKLVLQQNKRCHTNKNNVIYYKQNDRCKYFQIVITLSTCFYFITYYVLFKLYRLMISIHLTFKLYALLK